MYPTYEAKAKFSEILRQVRAGKTVTISYRGEPVAELRPIRRGGRDLEERLDELRERGVLVPASGTRPLSPASARRRPG